MAVKTSTKHPYAAIEHRVIDSPAYRALTYSARSLLTMLTRQITKDNNGHLQATFKYLKEYGFDSERTIGRGIQELIAHGFIYRTRLGGYQQGPSQYAVTWLPISNKKDIWLNGFVSCAWRNWNPDDKKTPPAKIPSITGKNVGLSPLPQDKNAVSRQDKNADIECVPCRGPVLVVKRRSFVASNTAQPVSEEAGLIGATKQPTKRTESPCPATSPPDPANDYTRTRDDAQDAAQWDSDTGEFIAIRQASQSATILHRWAA